jgi:hypothetical protein
MKRSIGANALFHPDPVPRAARPASPGGGKVYRLWKLKLMNLIQIHDRFPERWGLPPGTGHRLLDRLNFLNIVNFRAGAAAANGMCKGVSFIGFQPSPRLRPASRNPRLPAARPRP